MVYGRGSWYPGHFAIDNLVGVPRARLHLTRDDPRGAHARVTARALFITSFYQSNWFALGSRFAHPHGAARESRKCAQKAHRTASARFADRADRKAVTCGIAGVHKKKRQVCIDDRLSGTSCLFGRCFREIFILDQHNQ